MSRLLCLDYGSKRVGLAVSDVTLTLATALDCLEISPFPKFLASLGVVLKEKEISQILVGIPRNMDGSYGPSAQAARDFVQRLKETILIPIATVDERLSTVEASRRLHEAGKNARQQKALIDSHAARVMLQSYLDVGMKFI